MVCREGWMDGCRGGWMGMEDGCRGGWMGGWVDGGVDG